MGLSAGCMIRKGRDGMNVYLTPGDTRFSFMKFPRFLLDTGLNETCQILYVLLLDRARLSQKNRWVDADDHVFIYYPIQSLAKDMHKSVTTIKDSLKRLQEADLIDRLQQKAPMPTRIYVKIPAETFSEKKNESVGIPTYPRSEFRPVSGQKIGPTPVGFPATSKNKRIRVSEKDHPTYEYGGNTL